MKLFIWEGAGVLSDYTSGLIVALAPDLETAVAKIHEKCSWVYYPHVPSQIIDLDADPAPEAWLVHGGG